MLFRSHSHGNRADETVNVNDESITVLTETAPAVGSTEVLDELLPTYTVPNIVTELSRTL